MSELKPCPFCGGRNVMATIDPTMLNGNYYFRISHVRPPMECPLVNQFGYWKSSSKYTTREKAIEAWNRRVGESIEDH